MAAWQVLEVRDHGLLSPDAAHAFGAKLNAYHELVGDVMARRAFERSLALVLRDVDGRDVRMPSSATHPGHDLLIDGTPVSLKSEASRAIHPDRCCVSKLMESAWTKGFTRRSEFVAQLPRISAHLARYDAVLMLRALRDAGAVRYELLRFPTSVLRRVSQLEKADFTEVSAAGSSRARVLDERNLPLFDLVFDGSDQKVSVKNLARSAADVQAQWSVPEPPSF